MDDDDPQAVKRLLLYLYTFDYPEEDDSDVPMTMSCSHSPSLSSAATEEESNLGAMSNSFDDPTPRDNRMMNDVLVYAVAEKYDIPDLKDLAMHKFRTLASSKWSQDDFHVAMEAVFSTTPETDMGLRQIVLDICKEHSEYILRDKEFRAMMFENKAIAAVVLDATVQKLDQHVKLLDGALAEQATLSKELEAEKKVAKVALEKCRDWTSQLDGALQCIHVPQVCRHCGQKPKWLLERLDIYDTLGIQLRCPHCRTKH